MKDYRNPNSNLTLKSFWKNLTTEDPSSLGFTGDLSEQLTKTLPKEFINRFVDAAEGAPKPYIDTLNNNAPIGDLGVALKTAGQLAKSNRAATAGMGVLTALNLAGLFDNKQVGGQLIGSAAGAAIPALLMKGGLMKSNPVLGLAISQGGGALGSLFDKLRAKKAEEQAMAQQYTQY